MAIIDAHHHLWERGRFSYPWLRGNPVLDRDFLLREYTRLSAAAGVTHSVFVQAETEPCHGLQEARWALSMVSAEGPVTGVVAWAPVESNALEQHLDQLGDDPGLKGIRRLLQGEPDPRFCVRPEFVAGARHVAARELVLDICVYHHQLPAVIELVDAVPHGHFVLDHIGKPAIRSAQLEPWATHIRALAERDNVSCKLSGVATEADWECWSVADLQPYIETVIEAFGYRRLMFGSDWPVSTQAVSYARWLEIVEQALLPAGSEARAQVMAGTAAAVYGLSV